MSSMKYTEEEIRDMVYEKKKEFYKRFPAMSSDAALKQAIKEVAKVLKIKLYDMPSFTFSNTIG